MAQMMLFRAYEEIRDFQRIGILLMIPLSNNQVQFQVPGSTPAWTKN
jgi:hypothetical protein